MKYLNEKEDKQYSNLADDVAYIIFSESCKSLGDLNLLNSTEIDTKTVEVINNAVGEIVLDKVIEETKDLTREQLIKFLTLSLESSVMTTMSKHPEYTLKVMMRGMMKNKK